MKARQLSRSHVDYCVCQGTDTPQAIAALVAILRDKALSSAEEVMIIYLIKSELRVELSRGGGEYTQRLLRHSSRLSLQISLFAPAALELGGKTKLSSHERLIK